MSLKREKSLMVVSRVEGSVTNRGQQEGLQYNRYEYVMGDAVVTVID
jgi:hypothetical protein